MSDKFVQKTRTEMQGTRGRMVGDSAGRDMLCVLWPKRGDNIGTLARTATALGIPLVMCNSPLTRQVIKRGNTLGMVNIDLIQIATDPLTWIQSMKDTNFWVIGIEQTHNSKPIARFRRTKKRNLILVGNETSGIPRQALDLCDQVLEIPMNGTGNSLNVACAGTLGAYKVAGLV